MGFKYILLNTTSEYHFYQQISFCWQNISDQLNLKGDLSPERDGVVFIKLISALTLN